MGYGGCIIVPAMADKEIRIPRDQLGSAIRMLERLEALQCRDCSGEDHDEDCPS